MSAPFALDLGFEIITYEAFASGIGLGAALAGGFLGGLLAPIVGLTRGLWIAGIAQAVTNLAFCWLAWMGPVKWALAGTLAIEAFASGLGTVFFVAYLSSLCVNPLYTASQFALLTALAAVGRTVLSATSGYLAEFAGWIGFFALSAAIALPGLVLLAVLARAGVIEDMGGNDAETAESSA